MQKLVNSNISIKDAIKFLEDQDYIVVKRERSFKEYSDGYTIKYFYNKLAELESRHNLCQSEIQNLIISRDKEDKKALKEFNKKLLNKDNSLSNVEINTYICRCLDLLVKYYVDMKLTSCPSSLSFLLSDKGSWIFKKLKDVHHQKMLEFELSEEVVKYKESVYNDDQDKEFQSLQSKRHKDLLESVNSEEENGKKEKN